MDLGGVTGDASDSVLEITDHTAICSYPCPIPIPHVAG
jgi:hypothetical protein